jgi:hypothetical protein
MQHLHDAGFYYYMQFCHVLTKNLHQSATNSDYITFLHIILTCKIAS